MSFDINVKYFTVDRIEKKPMVLQYCAKEFRGGNPNSLNYIYSIGRYLYIYTKKHYTKGIRHPNILLSHRQRAFIQ